MGRKRVRHRLKLKDNGVLGLQIFGCPAAAVPIWPSRARIVREHRDDDWRGKERISRRFLTWRRNYDEIVRLAHRNPAARAFRQRDRVRVHSASTAAAQQLSVTDTRKTKNSICDLRTECRALLRQD